MTPIQVLYKRARVNPEGLAFAVGEKRWSYAWLAAQAESVARGLAGRGLREGDRIVLHSPNRPELVAGAYACFHIGAVAVPLGHRLQAVELKPLFERLRPSLYMGDARSYRQVEAIDGSTLPHERRFVIGHAGEHNRVQAWESLLDSNASTPLPVVTDIHTPAILLASFETTGIKLVTHTHATLTALFGLPFLYGC